MITEIAQIIAVHWSIMIISIMVPIWGAWMIKKVLS